MSRSSTNPTRSSTFRVAPPVTAASLLALSISLSTSAVADPVNVRTQPDGADIPSAYVLSGETRTYFGNVEGGSGAYSCKFTVDGTGGSPFIPVDPTYIDTTHSFAGSGFKTVSLYCEDQADPANNDTSTIELQVLGTDTALRRKNSAIDKGLRYIYQQQDKASGCFSGSGAPVASTGQASIAYENHGHNLDADGEDIYKWSLEKGLQCLYDNSTTVDMTDQPCIGNPEGDDGDPDLDGKGIRFGYTDQYYGPFAILAIVNSTDAATAQTIFPSTTSGSDLIDGSNSLFDIIVDAKDYLAWSQTDGGPDGGEGAQRCSVTGGEYGETIAAFYGGSFSDDPTKWFFDAWVRLDQYGQPPGTTCSDHPGTFGVNFGDSSPDGSQAGTCPTTDPDDSQRYSYIENGVIDTASPPEVVHTFAYPGDYTVSAEFDDQVVCSLDLSFNELGDEVSYGGFARCSLRDGGEGQAQAWFYGGALSSGTMAFDGAALLEAFGQTTDTLCDDHPGTWDVDFGDGSPVVTQAGTCQGDPGAVITDDPNSYVEDGELNYTYGGSLEIMHEYTPGDYTVTAYFDGLEICSLPIAVVDACGRNGWRYNENDSSIDNSVSQWPSLALLEAKKRWGIDVKQEVKDELDGWLDYSGDDGSCGNANGGGSYGYSSPCNWLNYAKAGAGLIMRNWTGYAAADPINQLSLDFLGNTYNQTGTGSDDNKGSFYPMYAAYKGLKLFGLATLEVPAGSGTNIDWETDYSDWLVANQNADGSWPSDTWMNGQMTTNFAVSMLAPEVASLPPVANAGGPYPDVIPEQDTQMDGSQSYHQDPDKTIVKYEWDFNATDGLWWDSKPAPAVGEGATGVTVTNPGYPDTGADATYTNTLRVTDNGTPPATDTDTATITVTTGNVPPVAVTNGPWAGVPSLDAVCDPAVAAAVNNPACYPITFDASGSSDPNAGPPLNDYIASYEWDIDGDGIFNEPGGEDGWPQGAPGSTDEWKIVKKLYQVPTSGLATLQVTDSFGLQDTASNQFVSIAFAFATDYSACYSVRTGRFTQQQGIAVTFENVGDGLAENVVMTMTGTPTNVTAVKNVTALGDIAAGATATSACGGTYATSDIVRDIQLNIPPSGDYTWRADFDFDGTHYTIPNLPPLAP